MITVSTWCENHIDIVGGCASSQTCSIARRAAYNMIFNNFTFSPEKKFCWIYLLTLLTTWEITWCITATKGHIDECNLSAIWFWRNVIQKKQKCWLYDLTIGKADNRSNHSIKYIDTFTYNDSWLFLSGTWKKKMLTSMCHSQSLWMVSGFSIGGPFIR